MFITPTPPTSSAMDEMANITVKMPLEIWFQRSVNVSWVEMEKSLSLFVATPRRIRKSCSIWSMARGMSSWVKVFATSIKSFCSGCIFQRLPIGMSATLSSGFDPGFRLLTFSRTPITRKILPSISTSFPMGSTLTGNSVSAVSCPNTTTFALWLFSASLIQRPAYIFRFITVAISGVAPTKIVFLAVRSR